MKKMTLLLLLGMFALNAAFGCESIFDNVKDMTCEIECLLCKDHNIDIKMCEKVREKFEKLEEATEEMLKAYKYEKELRTKIDALKKELDIFRENKEFGDEYKAKQREMMKLTNDLSELKYMNKPIHDAYSEALDSFLNEESLMLLESEEFNTEVEKVFEKLGE